MFDFFRRIADNRNHESMANRLRRKRFELFNELLNTLPKPLKIIDIGGTQQFWEQMNFMPGKDIEITILNLTKPNINKSGFIGIKGDATNMHQISNHYFDVAFSNSVIEHVGDAKAQRKMADEMQRIANNLFLQTPNKYFPIEPHFLFPFFQFFPINIKIWLLTHFKLGWYPKFSDKNTAGLVAQFVRLITKSELYKLFPNSTIHTERLGLLSKSFVLIR